VTLVTRDVPIEFLLIIENVLYYQLPVLTIFSEGAASHFILVVCVDSERSI
jgi:hypothetical protein